MPERRLQRALERLSAIGKVRDRTQAAQDITGAVVSVRSRLKDARTERESLLQAAREATTDQRDHQHPRPPAHRVQADRGRQGRPAERQAAARAPRRSRSRSRPTRHASGAAGRSDDWTPGDALKDAGRVLEVTASRAAGRAARSRCRSGWSRCSSGSRRVRPRTDGVSARSTLCSLAAACRRRLRTPPSSSAACRSSRSSAPTTWAAWPRSRSRAPTTASRSSSARATTRDTCYIVRSGHARAIRQHSDGRTITLARFGPGDIFGELAMFDDERRSATVEALDDLSTVAIPGSAMRGLLRAPPGDRGQARDRARAGGCGRPTSGSAPVLPDRAEPRRRRARPARASRRAPRARAAQRDVLVTATQAELAQLAGSSRESASRFLAVLERAGRDQPGARAADRARPRGPARLCLLSARSPSAGWSCATATCS